MQFYDIHGSGCSFTTYSGRVAVLQHSRVGMQFYNILRSGCSFTAYSGRDAVLQHTQVMMQFYNILRSAHFLIDECSVTNVIDTQPLLHPHRLFHNIQSIEIKKERIE